MFCSSFMRKDAQSRRDVVPMSRLLPCMILLAKVEKDSVEVICEFTILQTMELSQWGSRKRLRNSEVNASKVKSFARKRSWLFLIQLSIFMSWNDMSMFLTLSSLGILHLRKYELKYWMSCASMAGETTPAVRMGGVLCAS